MAQPAFRLSAFLPFQPLKKLRIAVELSTILATLLHAPSQAVSAARGRRVRITGRTPGNERRAWASPPSAREVLERVEPETGWAYTKVTTILNCLVEKGILQVRKRAGARFYDSLVTWTRAKRSAASSSEEGHA